MEVERDEWEGERGWDLDKDTGFSEEEGDSEAAVVCEFCRDVCLREESGVEHKGMGTYKVHGQVDDSLHRKGIKFYIYDALVAQMTEPIYVSK